VSVVNKCRRSLITVNRQCSMQRRNWEHSQRVAVVQAVANVHHCHWTKRKVRQVFQQAGFHGKAQ
jgi:hypothetical protein